MSRLYGTEGFKAGPQLSPNYAKRRELIGQLTVKWRNVSKKSLSENKFNKVWCENFDASVIRHDLEGVLWCVIQLVSSIIADGIMWLELFSVQLWALLFRTLIGGNMVCWRAFYRLKSHWYVITNDRGGQQFTCSLRNCMQMTFSSRQKQMKGATVRHSQLTRNVSGQRQWATSVGNAGAKLPRLHNPLPSGSNRVKRIL